MGLFSGKKVKVKADPLAGDINAAGKSGLDMLRGGASALDDVYKRDPSEVVNSQIAMENKFARSAAEDAGRRTRELIAQRGMGSSSVGLGAEVNNRKNMMDQLSMNSASGISRLRDMELQNAQGRMNAGNSLFNTKLQGNQNLQMNSYSYRKGGMGKLLGTATGAALGGYLGGTAGAKAGAQIGGGLGGYAQEQEGW